MAEGGFAKVFEAYDTIEGIPVALKVPHSHLMDKKGVEEFRREVRITAGLDHPCILPIKNADFIGDHFVIASRMGSGALDDLLENHRRMGIRRVVPLAEQMLEALAHAHARRIIHCDIKPSNFILFAGDHIRLADFGVAKLALETLKTTGAGTLGYMAPEHALGKPSLRSDCFSMALVLYEMLSGELPKWPFEWPPPGSAELRRQVPPAMFEFLQKGLQVDERKRFKSAVPMLAAFRRIKPRLLAKATRRRRKKANGGAPKVEWEQQRQREFRRRYGKVLELKSECNRCGGLICESMHACPWCGTQRKIHRGETRLPQRCPRCRRGLKSDWRYCPHCYGAAVGPFSTREYTDTRYVRGCGNPDCERKEVFPFMRYCPWCNRKVKKTFRLEPRGTLCPHCDQGIAADYWSHCPWCTKALE